MKALLQSGTSRRVPLPPEKRFITGAVKAVAQVSNRRGIPPAAVKGGARE